MRVLLIWNSVLQLWSSATLLSVVTPSAQRRRTRAVDVEKSILAAAHRLLEREGVDALTVRRVASEAGVAPMGLYHRFGGKEGLYAVVVARETTALLDGMTHALGQGGHPREMLERGALAFLDYVEDHTDGFKILVRD